MGPMKGMCSTVRTNSQMNQLMLSLCHRITKISGDMQLWVIDRLAYSWKNSGAHQWQSAGKKLLQTSKFTLGQCIDISRSSQTYHQQGSWRRWIKRICPSREGRQERKQVTERTQKFQRRAKTNQNNVTGSFLWSSFSNSIASITSNASEPINVSNVAARRSLFLPGFSGSYSWAAIS